MFYFPTKIQIPESHKQHIYTTTQLPTHIHPTTRTHTHTPNHLHTHTPGEICEKQMAVSVFKP